MSATIAEEKFISYFSDETIKTVKITWRSYPITRYHNPQDNPVTSIVSFVRGKKWNEELGENSPPVDKNVLVFCAGKKDIYDLEAALWKELGESVDIFPLHADISAEDRSIITAPGPHRKPRIILSTNIAQESVTIPYLTLVISMWEVKKVWEYDGVKHIGKYKISDFDWKQQSGRVGRIGPGMARLLLDTKPEDLEELPSAPIEEATLYREILQLAWRGGKTPSLNLREEIRSNNNSYFAHSINKANLEYAYRDLQLMGALDKQGNITTLGSDMLQFPLSVHNARILCEAIRREKSSPGCISNIIPLIAIQEVRSFVAKEGFWKEKTKGKNEGDLFALGWLLDELVRTNHTQEQLKEFTKYGISREALNNYGKLNPESRPPLALEIDLSPMGIKMPQLRKVIFMIDRLKKRLLHLNVVDETIFQENEWKIRSSKQIATEKICLATGSLNHFYTYNKKEKRFIRQWFEKWDMFQLGNSSSFDLERFMKTKSAEASLFIGQPFIIDQDENESLAFLTYITPIDQWIVDEALHQSSIRYETFTHNEYTEEDQPAYEHRKEEYIIATRRSTNPKEKAQKFIRDCLPYFLIEHNKRIRDRYHSYESIGQKQFVEIILPRHLENFEYLVQTEKPIEEIEDKFWGDTSIDYDLLDSDDTQIQAFLKNPEQPLISIKTEEKQNIWEYIDPDNERIALEIRSSLMKEIISIEWTVQEKIKQLNILTANLIETYKQKKISEINNIIQNDISIEEAIQKFFSYNLQKRQDIVRSINEYEQKFKTRERIFLRQAHIRDILERLSSDDWKNARDWMIQKLEFIEWGNEILIIKTKLKMVCTLDDRKDDKRDARLERHRKSTISLITGYLNSKDRVHEITQLPSEFHEIKWSILDFTHGIEHGENQKNAMFTRIYQEVFWKSLHKITKKILQSENQSTAQSYLIDSLDKISLEHFTKFEYIAQDIQGGVDARDTMETILSFWKTVKNSFEIQNLTTYHDQVRAQEHGIDKYISILSTIQSNLNVKKV